MSFKTIVTIFTSVLIAIIIFISRDQLVEAWNLLGKLDPWILGLLIPVQFISYYAVGEMVFSYLRAKKLIEHLSPFTLARMSLEMNFVNHVLPSGGISGVSYLTWRLSKYGVNPAKSTLAQLVRFAMGFVAFSVILAVAVIVVTLDNNLNRWIILLSTSIIFLIIGLVGICMYAFEKEARLRGLARWITKVTNKVVYELTFRHKKEVIKSEPIETFFVEMQDDYLALKKDKKLLIKPFIWGIVAVSADISLFLVSFYALGAPINPAAVAIAYGFAITVGNVIVTPGGAGAYETIMIAILAMAAAEADAKTVIAGILITRVATLLGTIVFGYVFYQHAIFKLGKPSHGKHPDLKG